MLRIFRSTSLCAARKRPSLGALHSKEPGINITSLDTVDANARLIDIRETEERITRPLPLQFTSEHKPLSSWQSQCLQKHQSYILLCAKGKCSEQLARKLRLEGYTQVYSLKNGVDELVAL